MKPPHVVIVGAGIIGTSIAWHVARAGAWVTIVDATEQGGVATRNSWAWINASWGNPEPYFRLRVQAIEDWHRLEEEIPGLHVSWIGSALWEIPPERLKSFQASHSAWGYDIRLVERDEIRRIEPYLANPPEFAVHAPKEGAVEPLAASRLLLTAAEVLGVTVIANNPVSGLIIRDGRVVGVQTSVGPVEADEVVLATGVGVTELVTSIGLTLPIRAAPALLVRTQPHEKRLNGLVLSPEIQLRQTPEGRFVAAVEFSPGDADADGARAAATARDLIRGMITPTPALFPDSHVIGVRPISDDGFPVVGRAPGVTGFYVAVMHSGITLAPAIGRMVADEIMMGKRDSLIAPYGGSVVLNRRLTSQFRAHSVPPPTFFGGPFYARSR
jgi:glycine/D-amino acid oxidase-like deaminating enzyme